jgi:hypothetical protein
MSEVIYLFQWITFLGMLGGLVSMIFGEVYYYEYLIGQDTSNTNKQGSIVGLALGFTIFIVCVIAHAVLTETFHLLSVILLITGSVLLTVGPYYFMAGNQNNDASARSLGQFLLMGGTAVMAIVITLMLIQKDIYACIFE